MAKKKICISTKGLDENQFDELHQRITDTVQDYKEEISEEE